jgi:hypothetical protein
LANFVPTLQGQILDGHVCSFGVTIVDLAYL